MSAIDLVAAVLLTAGAGVLVAVVVLAAPGVSARTRWRAAIGFAAWLAALVAAAAAGGLDPKSGLGTPALGLAVLLPVLVLAYLGRRTGAGRSFVREAALPVLIGAHAVRMLGIFFVLLYAAGRLPAPFAPLAGWGDVFIGVTALPLAWAVARGAAGARGLAVAWTALGMLDLIDAVALGTMSAADSPWRVFTAAADTTIMSHLPWILIPAYAVPILFVLQLAALDRLFRPRGLAVA